jgi:hypothetical protein
VHAIEEADIGYPHAEGTVTVDGVLLEISVHFVGSCIGRIVLVLP